MAGLVTSARRVLSQTPAMLGLPFGKRGAGLLVLADAAPLAPRACDVARTDIRPRASRHTVPATTTPFICHRSTSRQTPDGRLAASRDWRWRVASRPST